MSTEEDYNKLMGDCEWNGVKCETKSNAYGYGGTGTGYSGGPMTGGTGYSGNGSVDKH